MIGFTGKRGVAMISGIASVAVLVLLALLITSAGALQPKCRYSFSGVWLYEHVGTDEVVVVAMSPVDVVGKREGCGTGMLVDSDPVAYGGVSWSQCQVRTVSTGKYTFDTRGVCYLLDANQQKVLILLLGGPSTWIDENHQEFEFFSKIYLASQDTDGDGWPDQGEPVQVNRWTYLAERMEWFPEPA